MVEEDEGFDVWGRRLWVKEAVGGGGLTSRASGRMLTGGRLPASASELLPLERGQGDPLPNPSLAIPPGGDPKAPSDPTRGSRSQGVYTSKAQGSALWDQPSGVQTRPAGSRAAGPWL